MIWRASLLTASLALLASISPSGTIAQNIDTIKKGVARIKNTRFGDVGTGFIIKKEKDRIYIITSAHIVRGDEQPSVYLFRQLGEPLKATLIDREDEELKGLALLIVNGDERLFSESISLELGQTVSIKGGEIIQVVGYPEGTQISTVTIGNVARIEGRNIVLSGDIRPGNSGSPIILNGKVIGLVTDMRSLSYATQAESITLYLNGIEPNWAISNKSIPYDPQPSSTPSTNDSRYYGLNQAVFMIVKTGQDDFYTLVGPPTAGSKSAFHSKTKIPGATYTWVYPKERVVSQLVYSSDRRKIETEYYNLVSTLRLGFSDWEFKEEPKDADSGDAKHRRFKLREKQKGAVVEVSYNLTTSDIGGYVLFLTIWSPSYNWVW